MSDTVLCGSIIDLTAFPAALDYLISGTCVKTIGFEATTFKSDFALDQNVVFLPMRWSNAVLTLIYNLKTDFLTSTPAAKV